MVDREGHLLNNYSSFLSSLLSSKIDLNLTSPSSFIHHFDRHVSLKRSSFNGEVVIVLSEVLENQTTLSIHLVRIPSIHFSCQIIRLSSFLSVLFNQTPLTLHNIICPLSDSLGVCLYDPSFRSFSSIIEETKKSLPKASADSCFQYYLWRSCNSSEDWSKQMSSFSTSLNQCAFETTFLSMGVLNSTHLMMNCSNCTFFE